MTKCILIFDEIEECLGLLKLFDDKSIYLAEGIIIKPDKEKTDLIPDLLLLETNKTNIYKVQDLLNIRVLNPKLDRKLRQQSMRKWLMPFGFIAGLGFSNMTNLSTFSILGLNNLGETIFGGLLGMGSGYLGSIFASASINLNRNKELRSIINFNKNGKWLLLLESQTGYELPWMLIKESKTKDIVFLES